MDSVGVRRIVCGAIKTFLPHVAESEIAGHLHIRDLGADSVERVEIIASIVDTMGLRVALSSFSDIENIDALVAFLLEAHENG